MERYLGNSNDAGISDAIRWANSDDPIDRDFAAQILGDIGTGEALKYEQTLSRDSNHDVASWAKYQLEHWGKPHPAQASVFERPQF